MTTINRQPEPAGPSLSDLQRKLTDRLRAFGQRVRAHMAIIGTARVIVLIVALIVGTLIIDRWLQLSLEMRGIAAVALLGLILHRIWVDLVVPLRGSHEPVELAAAIDRRKGNDTGGAAHTPIASRVATVLQLPQQLQSKTPPSAAMVGLAVRRSAAELDEVSFDKCLDGKQRNQHIAGIVTALLVVVLLIAIAPSTMATWASRWLLLSETQWPQATYMELQGLRDDVLTVPRGEQTTLRVLVREDSVMPGSVQASWRDSKGRRHEQAMTQFAPDDYRLELPPLYDDATLTLRGNDARIGPITVKPVDRPRVTELLLSHTQSTAAAPHDFMSSAPNPSYLSQSPLELTLTANTPLAEVIAHVEAGSTIAFERVDDTRFVARWTHDDPVHMAIELIARDAPLQSLPLPISIGLQRDKAPRVSIRYTGVRQRVTSQARIPLTIETRDDFGIATVTLMRRVGGDALPPASAGDAADAPAPAAPEVIETLLYGPASPATSTAETTSMALDLKPFDLADDTLLEIWVRSVDAAEPDAQTGLSRLLAFRITPSDQLFREILMRLQGDRARLRRLTTMAEEIRDELLLTVRAGEYEELARKHRALQREAARVAGSIQEAVTEMQLNGLGSVETHQMIQHHVADRLFAVVGQDMVTQRQALDELARSPGDALHRQANDRQVAIVAALHEVLKQMAQWDSFIDVLNQLEEIIRLQRNIQRQTKGLDGNPMEGIFEDD